MQQADELIPTLLHQAAYQCELDRVVELQGRGADPNAIDEQGYTPLHWCAFRGLVGGSQHLIAKELLDTGSNPNAIIPGFSSVLNLAVESGNKLLVAVVIEGGADVNLAANDVTALMTAARRGDGEMVKMLLEAGADPRKRCGSFKACEYAEYYGHEEIAELLRAGV